MAIPDDKMEYRRLGNSGVKVSVLGFGSWVTFDAQLDDDLALECMQAAHDAGCNFFDNAEAYAGGRSEAIMGRALHELGWPRWSYVVTTKLFWGVHGDDPNMRNTLNRKYLMQGDRRVARAFPARLRRRRLLPSVRPDTPMEETVCAMSDMITQGQALYWGTSEWSADEIRHAIDIAERHHLHQPVTEQSQYNLLERTKVEVGVRPPARRHRLRQHHWSPLASGLLTGKYRDGIPEDSRAALAGYEWLASRMSDDAAIAKIERLRPIAGRLGCSMAQLALAWCTKHSMVSSVITGASRASQVVENFEALDVIPLFTDDVKAEMERVLE